MKKIVSSIAALTLLSGCASIVAGSTQEVKLATDPQQNVTCEARNGRGVYPANGQPGNILVKRSQTRLEVECQNADYSGTLSHRAHVEPWFFGNILIGGLIGVIVDPITGAMFAYDEQLTVPLTTKTAALGPNGSVPTGKFPALMTEPASTTTTSTTSSATGTTTTTTTTTTAPAATAPVPAQASEGLLSYDELVARGLIVNAPAK